jgi:hypothetical protein
MFVAFPVLAVSLVAAACTLLSCATPLAGLAAAAALTLPRRVALVVICSAWLVNQLLGFGFRGYPHTVNTFAWGAVLGVAAIAAMNAATFVPRSIAFIASFAAFEGVLVIASVWLGDWGAYAPIYLLQGFLLNAIAFALAYAGSRKFVQSFAPASA